MASGTQEDTLGSEDDIKTMVRRILLSQDKLDKDVRVSITQHAEHSAKIDKLNTEVRTLSVQLDRNQREKNIVLFNLPCNGTSTQDLVAAVRRAFEMVSISLPDWAIDNVFCLRGSGAKRPVLVKLTTAIWVRQIFSKAADLRKLGIRVDNDLSPGEREAKKALLTARWKLKTAGINAVIRKNSLLLDGRRIDPADVESILQRAKIPAPPATSSETLTSLPGAGSAVLTQSELLARKDNSCGANPRSAPPPPPTGAASVSTVLADASAVPSLPPGGALGDARYYSPSLQKERKRTGSPHAAGNTTKKNRPNAQTRSSLRQSKLNFRLESLPDDLLTSPEPVTQPTETPMSTSDTEG